MFVYFKFASRPLAVLSVCGGDTILPFRHVCLLCFFVAPPQNKKHSQCECFYVAQSDFYDAFTSIFKAQNGLFIFKQKTKERVKKISEPGGTLIVIRFLGLTFYSHLYFPGFKKFIEFSTIIKSYSQKRILSRVFTPACG